MKVIRNGSNVGGQSKGRSPASSEGAVGYFTLETRTRKTLVVPRLVAVRLIIRCQFTKNATRQGEGQDKGQAQVRVGAGLGFRGRMNEGRLPW